MERSWTVKKKHLKKDESWEKEIKQYCKRTRKATKLTKEFRNANNNNNNDEMWKQRKFNNSKKKKKSQQPLL